MSYNNYTAKPENLRMIFKNDLFTHTHKHTTVLIALNMIVGKVEWTHCISSSWRASRTLVQFDTSISAIPASGCAYFFVYVQEDGWYGAIREAHGRRCRLRATIRSGTGIPGSLSAINNRSTSREWERKRDREKDRMRNYLPFLSRGRKGWEEESSRTDRNRR